MYRVSIFLSIMMTLLLQSHHLYSLADISFIVIDLKYSKDRGVKICEIQPGSYSRCSGSNALEKAEIIEHRYCDYIENYHLKGYFTHPLYSKMKQVCIERGWSSIHSGKDLSKKIEKTGFIDPDNLYQYKACLFSLEPYAVLRGDPLRYPEILFLDRAILPYCQNKFVTNCLLDALQETRALRPVWRVYRKEFSQNLVERICNDIPGEIVVLKLIRSTMGRGVIIVEKKQLAETLNYIFNTPKKELIQDMDRSYSEYATDPLDSFIVEEFIPSDPLLLGDQSEPYDCTMRIAAILSYHQKRCDISFLGQYWYSPNKPIDPQYSLIQSHKAKGTYFSTVDIETLRAVENQIKPALLKLYQYMLDQYDANIRLSENDIVDMAKK